MGKCFSHRRNEHFSIDDLNGIENYYSLMSKRKVDVLRWMIDSQGPWKTPNSFVDFKLTDAYKNPLKISNEDEIQNNVDKNISIHFRTANSNITLMNSNDVKNDVLLDWPSDW